MKKNFTFTLVLCGLCLPTSAIAAAIDYEVLIATTGCPVAGQSAADWDAFAECQSTSGTWARGPVFLGGTSDTCDSNHAGMLQWTGSSLQYCSGSGWTNVGGGLTGGTQALSYLTSALGSNTIDNATYAQTWMWNTLTTGVAMTLSSTSETSGTVFNLTNSNTTGAGAVLNINTTSTGAAKALQGAVSGASNTGTAGYFSNSSPTGWGIYSSGTSPNYFGGYVNVALGAGYQINGGTILTLPASDTTSIAVGSSALASQSSTNLYNTAVGNAALFSATSATYNTAIGYQAVYSLNTGSYVTGVGYQALYSATAGPNDAFGYQAGEYIGSGVNNVAFGSQAMLGSSGMLLTGNDNTAVGNSALYSIQGAAANNTAAGAQALYSSTTGSGSTAAGYQALYSTTAGPNDAFGYQAGYMISTGTANVGVGYQSMASGSKNNLTGNGNTAVGDGALGVAKGAATGNTAFGTAALGSNTTGSDNTAVGGYALYSNKTGSQSTAAGYEALDNATAGPNDAFGYQSLTSTTTGTGNVGFGYQTLYTNVSGTGNTAVGNSALYSTTGSGNTAFGYYAGYAGTANTTGSYNTFIGYQAQANGAAYTNGTAIGSSAVLTASNSIVLGNSSIATIYAKVTSITAISDRRLKKDIMDLPSDLGLEFIGKLKPVSYRFNNGDETQRYGVIAQDLEAALPQDLQDIVESAAPEHGLALIERQHNKDRTYRVNYGELTSPIVKSIQEQQAEIAIDRAEIIRLGTPDDGLGDKMQSLNMRLNNETTQLYISTAIACLCGLLLGILFGRRKNNS